MLDTLHHPRMPGALASVLLFILVLGCGDSPPATRRITGSRTVAFWPDQGKGSPLASADTRAPARLIARSFDGKTTVSASFDAAGGFTLDGAPVGAYLLEFDPSSGARHFFRTEAATVDLGGDVLGRSDVRAPSQPMQVTFDLSGLSASNPQDLIEITCSNASVWERLAPQGTLGTGLTSVSVPFDWKARPTPLVDGQLGDVLYVHQLSTHVAAGSGISYQAAETWVEESLLTVTDGGNQHVPAVLSPATASGRLSILWRPMQFETALADWPANTLLLDHRLFVEGIAGQLDLGPSPRSGNPDLVQIIAPPGTPDATLDLPYGRFLPTLWKERLQGYVTVRLRFPFLGGTIFYSVRMSSQAAMDALPPELVPTLHPPRSVRIGGGDAYQVRTGVGTGPLISWTAPGVGIPDYYVVDIEQLQISGSQVTFIPIATFHTTETQAQFPSDTLSSGNQYVAFLTATREPTSHYATAPAPYRRHFPQDFAQTATAPFSP